MIFLCAQDTQQNNLKVFEAGGADYVTKPVRASELMARIGTHLALQRARRELQHRNIELEAIQITFEERTQERSAELENINSALRREVDANRRTLAELRKSERNYRRIIDTANEGIWVIGPDAKTVLVNARMAGMLGYKAAEMVSLPMSAFLYEEDVPANVRTIEALRNGFSQHYERRLRHKAGYPLHTLDIGHAHLGRRAAFPRRLRHVHRHHRAQTSGRGDFAA